MPPRRGVSFSGLPRPQPSGGRKRPRTRIDEIDLSSFEDMESLAALLDGECSIPLDAASSVPIDAQVAEWAASSDLLLQSKAPEQSPTPKRASAPPPRPRCPSPSSSSSSWTSPSSAEGGPAAAAERAGRWGTDSDSDAQSVVSRSSAASAASSAFSAVSTASARARRSLHVPSSLQSLLVAAAVDAAQDSAASLHIGDGAGPCTAFQTLQTGAVSVPAVGWLLEAARVAALAAVDAARERLRVLGQNSVDASWECGLCKFKTLKRRNFIGHVSGKIHHRAIARIHAIASDSAHIWLEKAEEMAAEVAEDGVDRGDNDWALELPSLLPEELRSVTHQLDSLPLSGGPAAPGILGGLLFCPVDVSAAVGFVHCVLQEGGDVAVSIASQLPPTADPGPPVPTLLDRGAVVDVGSVVATRNGCVVGALSDVLGALSEPGYIVRLALPTAAMRDFVFSLTAMHSQFTPVYAAQKYANMLTDMQSLHRPVGNDLLDTDTDDSEENSQLSAADVDCAPDTDGLLQLCAPRAERPKVTDTVGRSLINTAVDFELRTREEQDRVARALDRAQMSQNKRTAQLLDVVQKAEEDEALKRTAVQSLRPALALGSSSMTHVVPPRMRMMLPGCRPPLPRVSPALPEPVPLSAPAKRPCFVPGMVSPPRVSPSTSLLASSIASNGSNNPNNGPVPPRVAVPGLVGSFRSVQQSPSSAPPAGAPPGSAVPQPLPQAALLRINAVSAPLVGATACQSHAAQPGCLAIPAVSPDGPSVPPRISSSNASIRIIPRR